MSPSSAQNSSQGQKREVTRSRLLDAALEAFRTKGYVQTTADDIASHAGCSRATFYLYFNSKSSVMIAILDRLWPNMLVEGDALAHAMAAGITQAELRAEWARQLSLWKSSPGAITAFHIASETDPDVAEWRKANFLRAFAVIETNRGKLGSTAKVRRDLKARLLLLERMSLAALVAGAANVDDVSDDQVVDYLAELWAELLT